MYDNLAPWVTTFVYGILDELHQIRVLGRSETLADIKLDSASTLMGAVVAVIIVEIVKRMYDIRKNLL